MDYQDQLNELGKQIVNLCEEYQSLPPYEVGSRLIAHATNLLLFCAPNECVAMKTILASVEIGISEFQEQHK